MDFIKEIWEQQARQFGTSHAASWQDIFAINLEIETIAPYIKEGDTILDVGCANGFSAFSQLKRGPGKIVGVDFSENMIESANVAREALPAGEKQKTSFQVGDIRHLDFGDETFDVVYTTRVLINLPNWREQAQGLAECIRVTRKGGTVVISEAFWEPLVKLNALRSVCGLPSLVEHDFNRYLKKKNVETYLSEKKLTFKNIEFSSIYYLGSRFLRDLVTDLKDKDNYTNPINSVFFDLEKKHNSFGGFGIQQAFVITK